MKAGAVEFLTKPFHDQYLLDAVQVALERDRTRRARDRDHVAVADHPRERDLCRGRRVRVRDRADCVDQRPGRIESLGEEQRIVEPSRTRRRVRCSV